MSAPDYSTVENPTAEWRRSEFNRRNLLSRAAFYQEILPIMQALAAGSDAEELDLLAEGEENWHSSTGSVIVPTCKQYIYRIKQPPQPKWIPWTIDTAPTIPLWVRGKGKTTRRLVLAMGEGGISTSSAHISYAGLLVNYEYTEALFRGLNWKPCGTLTDPKLNENKS